MSLAADTRAAVRRHPFLYHALRAGVANYTAAARFLDLGETEAVAAALRRYADDLPGYEPPARGGRITMQSGLGRVADPADALLAVNGTALAPGAGSLTGVLAAGDVDARVLGAVLERFAVDDVPVEAAGVVDRGDAGDGDDGTLVVVVERPDGPDALRLVEDALG